MPELALSPVRTRSAYGPPSGPLTILPRGMTPDSIESHRERDRRLGDLEREQARMKQELADVRDDVHRLEPLVVMTTELKGGIVGVNRELESVKSDVGKILEALDTRDQQTTAERAANRRALMALTGVIGAALIGGLATVIAVVVA